MVSHHVYPVQLHRASAVGATPPLGRSRRRRDAAASRRWRPPCLRGAGGRRTALQALCCPRPHSCCCCCHRVTYALACSTLRCIHKLVSPLCSHTTLYFINKLSPGNLDCGLFGDTNLPKHRPNLNCACYHDCEGMRVIAGRIKGWAHFEFGGPLDAHASKTWRTTGRRKSFRKFRTFRTRAD